MCRGMTLTLRNTHLQFSKIKTILLIIINKPCKAKRSNTVLMADTVMQAIGVSAATTMATLLLLPLSIFPCNILDCYLLPELNMY